ncbi:hypothetical protein [Picosynechococcus sp. PCC 7003]|uniref:hypothetical protein n=1 Tax=Picosynechococcus sp. PCC 7003 TaxID=374981 RepID=UPI0012ED2B57|nr:hypothetical protein [Picosynechococcus sp. PCC 7003]
MDLLGPDLFAVYLKEIALAIAPESILTSPSFGEKASYCGPRARETNVNFCNIF